MGSNSLAARAAIVPVVAARALFALLLLAAPAWAQMGISLKSAQEQEMERRTAAALAGTISFDFRETPLADVVEFLSEKLGMSCELDRRALEEPNLDGSTRVTFKTAAAVAGPALTRLLASVDEGLTWTVRDNVLLITTKTKAASQENFEIRIYPVRDLVETRVGGRIEVDYDTLIDVIQSSIAPDTWGDAPGQGSIKGFDKAQVLVVSHLSNVHTEIAQLLQTLRAVQAFQSGDGGALRRLGRENERSAPGSAAPRGAGPQPGWRMPQVYH